MRLNETTQMIATVGVASAMLELFSDYSKEELRELIECWNGNRYNPWFINEKRYWNMRCVNCLWSDCDLDIGICSQLLAIKWGVGLR